MADFEPARWFVVAAWPFLLLRDAFIFEMQKIISIRTGGEPVAFLPVSWGEFAPWKTWHHGCWFCTACGTHILERG